MAVTQRKTTTMTETLLNSLLVNPKPIARYGGIYKSIEHRLFPDKSHFIEFLQTDDSTERIQLAKGIMKRICFDSNYPPPFRLLLNVLDTEGEHANKASGGAYLPQDHFVHMLNLYLLGVYVFFYHPTLNKSLVSFFSNVRNEQTRNRNLNGIKDFLSSWKYFCLFHDLSYPLEILYKVKKDEKTGEDVFHKPPKKLFERYLDIYNHIPEMSNRECLAEAVAKLYMANQLLGDYQNSPIANYFRNLDYSFTNKEKQMLSSADIADSYSDFIGIDKIYTFDHFKALLNFIPGDELLTVLLEVSTGNPIGFLRHKDETKEIYVISKSNSVNRDRLENMLVNDEYLMDERYRIMYFVKDIAVLKSKIMESCGINEGDFAAAKHLIQNELEANQQNYAYIPFYRIDNPQSFGSYLFQTYECVTEKFDAIFLNNKLGQYSIPEHYMTSGVATTQNRSQIYEKYMRDDFTENLSRIISGYFKKNVPDIVKHMKRVESDKSEVIQTELFKTLSTHFNPVAVSEILESACGQFSDDMVTNLRKEINETNALTKTFMNMCKNMSLNDLKGITHVATSGVAIQTLLSAIKSNNVLKCIVENIDKKLSNEHQVTLDRLLEYRTIFTRYDHGILSCLYYLYSCGIVFGIIDDPSIKTPKLKFLIWDVDENHHQTKLIDNYRYVVEQTAYSILCHNIFAEPFKQRYNHKWQIKLSASPFAYFCSLMDSLQIWNREKYMSHVSHIWRPEFSYSDYDIYVKNDQLVIQFLSKIKNFEKLKTEKVNSLNDFLVQCTDHISVVMQVM